MRIPKYSRRNMYVVDSQDGSPDIDLSNNRISLFVVTKPIRYYQITRYEDQRPDVICNNIYGDTDFWWVLLLFNDIVDVFTELREGLILKVPDKKDISDFINRARSEMRQEQKLLDPKK